MSKYTTEVRFICETYAGLKESVGYDRVNEVIENSRRNIFGDYPIFDESYRGILETKILKHYYTREISEETVGLWKLRLNTRMNEIMPYFNKLYDSELIKFNPLYDVDLTKDYKKVNDDKTDSNTKQNTSSESNTKQTGSAESSDEDKFTGEVSTSNENHSESTNWNKFNDTPQGAITGLDNDDYITSATKVTTDEDSDGSGTENTDNTRTIDRESSSENNGDYTGGSESNSKYENKFDGIEDYLEHVVGANGGMSYSKKLKEFRETFLNIDLQIIDNLKNLFFYLL